jgi:uncharacterized protein with PIN domain
MISKIRHFFRFVKSLGLREALADLWRTWIRDLAWWLEGIAKRLARCYVCGEQMDTVCCESCRRFVCSEHEDQDRSWEDCDMCQACGDALDADPDFEEEHAS